MITGPEQPAVSGTTKQLVIILHGWGADGINLIDLARPWGLTLPDAHFCAPNAPHLCEANPLGYQWFSLMDRSPAQMLAGAADAATYVNAYIDAKLHKLSSISEGEASRPSETGDKIKVALVGFSQGTMTALHVGLRRPDVSCVLGYSGALLDTPEMVRNITPPPAGGHGGETSKNKTASPLNPPASGGRFPSVSLIHGENDDIVPFASMAHAETVLKACGINVTTHARPNLPHSIDMQGVEIGGKFLAGELD